MAGSGRKFYFTTLRDCLIFFNWLNTEKKDMHPQIAAELYDRISKYYHSADKSKMETALSTFVSNVNKFYTKLVKTHVPPQALAKAASIKASATVQEIVAAIVECTPKLLAALYFLCYDVTPNFRSLGGGGWKENWLGYDAASWGGDLATYLHGNSVSSNYGGIIPGGFNYNDSELRYRDYGGYPQGYYMKADLEKILDKTKDQFFRDVLLTTVNAGAYTQKENAANVLALVGTFCEIVERDTNDQVKNALIEERLRHGKCLPWEQLKQHCAQLKKSQIHKLFNPQNFSHTGQSVSDNTLKTTEFAANTAKWLRDNLDSVRQNLNKIDTNFHALDNKADNLGEYFTKHFFPYGFTFGFKHHQTHEKNARTLLQTWRGAIDNLKAANDGGLAKLKKYLDGEPCPPALFPEPGPRPAPAPRPPRPARPPPPPRPSRASTGNSSGDQGSRDSGHPHPGSTSIASGAGRNDRGRAVNGGRGRGRGRGRGAGAHTGRGKAPGSRGATGGRGSGSPGTIMAAQSQPSQTQSNPQPQPQQPPQGASKATKDLTPEKQAPNMPHQKTNTPPTTAAESLPDVVSEQKNASEPKSTEPLATETEATKTEATKPVATKTEATKTEAAKPHVQNAVDNPHQNNGQSEYKLPAPQVVTSSPDTAHAATGVQGPVRTNGDRGQQGPPNPLTSKPSQVLVSQPTDNIRSPSSPPSALEPGAVGTADDMVKGSQGGVPTRQQLAASSSPTKPQAPSVQMFGSPSPSASSTSSGLSPGSSTGSSVPAPIGDGGGMSQGTSSSGSQPVSSTSVANTLQPGVQSSGSPSTVVASLDGRVPDGQAGDYGSGQQSSQRYQVSNNGKGTAPAVPGTGTVAAENNGGGGVPPAQTGTGGSPQIQPSPLPKKCNGNIAVHLWPGSEMTVCDLKPDLANQEKIWDAQKRGMLEDNYKKLHEKQQQNPLTTNHTRPTQPTPSVQPSHPAFGPSPQIPFTPQPPSRSPVNQRPQYVPQESSSRDGDDIVLSGKAIEDPSYQQREKLRRRNAAEEQKRLWDSESKQEAERLKQQMEKLLRDNNILTETLKQQPTQPNYAEASALQEHIFKKRLSHKSHVTGHKMSKQISTYPKPFPQNHKLRSILNRASLPSNQSIGIIRTQGIRPITAKVSHHSDITSAIINSSPVGNAQVKFINRRVKGPDLIPQTNLPSQSAIIPGVSLDPIPLPSDTALKLHRQMETHKKFPMLDRLSQGKNGIPPPDMWIDRPRKVQRNTQNENIDNIAQGIFDPAPPPPSTWSEDTNTHILSDQYPMPKWHNALEIDKVDDAKHKTDNINIPQFATENCQNPWSVTSSAPDTAPVTPSPLPASDRLPLPRTVREMLYWFVGLSQYGCIGVIGEHIKGVLEGYNADAVEVTLEPYTLDASLVTAKLTETCLYSATVIYKIKYKDISDAFKDFFKDTDKYAFYYATDPAGLLCQLRDYVYACHHQLAFLKAQCNRDELHGGWQSHEYGSDLKTSSPLQAFLTDGWDSDFETHLFDPCNLCHKSRIRMGFRDEDLPENQQTGSTLSTILTPSCGGSDPLLTLSSYLNCLTRRTPRTTGELVSYFHHFGYELHDYYQKALSSLGTALSTSHADCPEWDCLRGTDLQAVRGIRGHESLISKHNHDEKHPRTLSTLVGCSDSANCPQSCSPITYRAYALYSQSFAHTYLSWTVYLPDRLWESLENLRYDLQKHLVSGKCTSLYSCSTALPLLYLHGFTPPEVGSQSTVKCSDVIGKLEEIVDGKPIASLMTAMDNFLFTIREPFIFTLVALWSLAFLIFANTMLYRIDILHIRSHLIRTKASHLIDVKALLSDNKKMMSLYDANYFDDYPNELLNLR